MSVKGILSMADTFRKEFERSLEDTDGNPSESDPEIWETLLLDTLVDDIEWLKTYKLGNTSEEKAALRDLYTVVRQILDEALIPSTLAEAGYCMRDMFELLGTIAKKDQSLADQFQKDLASDYLNNEDDYTRELAEKAAATLKRSIRPQKDMPNSGTDTTSSLAGKTVVFTGTLSSMTREDASSLAIAFGASVAKDLSKNTDILVVGDNSGSKLQKAEALGVKTITEAQWNEITKQPSKKAVP